MADWTLASDTMLLRPYVFTAKKKNNYYLLNTPNNSRIATCSIDMYIDDATTFTGMPSHKEYVPDAETIKEKGDTFIHDAAETITENMQESWSTWSKLTYIAGQFPAFVKYLFQTLTWKVSKAGRLVTATNAESKCKVTMEDHLVFHHKSSAQRQMSLKMG